MIYRYDTKEINGLDYIISSRLVSNSGYADPSKHEYPQAFIRGLTDHRGKPRWVIDRDNPKDIREVLQPPTLEELEAERVRDVRQNIRRAYTSDDEIKLLNAAIESLIAGKPVPQEYLEYRTKVRQIKEGSHE